MKKFNLADMTGGWFVGDFSPTAYKSNEFETAVKVYKAGDQEARHHHKIATEITVIVTGKVIMCGKEWSAGSIVLLEPGDSTAFECLEDSITFVVKSPSVSSDKYLD